MVSKSFGFKIWLSKDTNDMSEIGIEISILQMVLFEARLPPKGT
jgi:hypothetical protein